MPLLTDKCPTCGKRKTRSIPQNSRYWSLMNLAAEKLGHTKEIWHEWFKQKFLPSRVVEIAGLEVLLSCPTHNLPMHPDPQNPQEPNWETYTMRVEVWLAEHGVYLED